MDLLYALPAHRRRRIWLAGISGIRTLASLAAQYLLRGYYRPLIARNSRYRKLLISWGCIYVAVAIQLAWLLRPFVGAQAAPVEFLRPEAWDNACVLVAWMVLRAAGF